MVLTTICLVPQNKWLLSPYLFRKAASIEQIREFWIMRQTSWSTSISFVEQWQSMLDFPNIIIGWMINDSRWMWFSSSHLLHKRQWEIRQRMLYKLHKVLVIALRVYSTGWIIELSQVSWWEVHPIRGGKITDVCTTINWKLTKLHFPLGPQLNIYHISIHSKMNCWRWDKIL